MEGISTKRSTCRLCDSSHIIMVLPIKPSPIADAFVNDQKLNEVQPLIPLDLYQCQSCGHVQNLDIVNPNLLFRDYIFQTSHSMMLIEHFRKYAQEVINKFSIEKNSLVVEIGSNDGTLLKFFKEHGMKIVGVDPAIEISKNANEAMIPTISEFFTLDIAKAIRKEYGPAKLIIANNVYAHTDQMNDMTNAIHFLLDKDGLFIFEVSYLLDIIEKFLFDTIYHEHLSYHSIQPFKQFFKLHNLHLFDIERIPTKGGSIRGFVQKTGGFYKEKPIIQELIEKEINFGLYEAKTFVQYESAILQKKDYLHQYIDDALDKNMKIIGYGASTTVITLMYHFELENKLSYLVDDNQTKQGLYSPGTHLKVKPSSVLYSEKPDIALILAWQYSHAIINKHLQYMKNGGIFAVPLPSFKLIEAPIEHVA